jgi:hypothetical protein
MEAEREAVRLVADPLQQLQPWRMAVELDRVRPVGDEHLLVPLGQRDHGDARQVECLQSRHHGRELPLAAVDHDQVRRGRERLVVLLVSDVAHAGETPRDDLGERRVVVLPLQPANAELPVVRFLGERVLKDDHRADRRLGLDVRDVVALDPDRQTLEVERLAELLERLHPA